MSRLTSVFNATLSSAASMISQTLTASTTNTFSSQFHTTGPNCPKAMATEFTKALDGDTLTKNGIDSISERDCLSALPVELLLIVNDQLSYADKISFALTSKYVSRIGSCVNLKSQGAKTVILGCVIYGETPSLLSDRLSLMLQLRSYILDRRCLHLCHACCKYRPADAEWWMFELEVALARRRRQGIDCHEWYKEARKEDVGRWVGRSDSSKRSTNCPACQGSWDSFGFRLKLDEGNKNFSRSAT